MLCYIYFKAIKCGIMDSFLSAMHLLFLFRNKFIFNKPVFLICTLFILVANSIISRLIAIPYHKYQLQFIAAGKNTQFTFSV